MDLFNDQDEEIYNIWNLSQMDSFGEDDENKWMILINLPHAQP